MVSNNRVYKYLAVALVVSSAVSAFAQSCVDHGVPTNGMPNWQERTMLVATNAVRISPYQYRDTFLTGYNILTPTWYSPVTPLQWDNRLGQSAKAHSIDLAYTTGCPFQHNSCDGTNWIRRIESYYPNWSSLGENAAGGYTDPMATVNGLLLDPMGGAPAPDGSAGDGHRRAIMSSIFYHMGAGYMTGPNPMLRYWTQDFGRTQAAFTPCSPLYSGSHAFRATSVDFYANYYDANNLPPQSASVIINNVSYPITVLLGTAARGTYRYSTPLGASCRSYHFEFRDASGAMKRYPAHGELRTFNEGSCTEDFTNALCAVDFNASGDLSPDDFFDFLNAWFAGDPRTDYNHNGVLEMQDIFDFINAWMVGCPSSDPLPPPPAPAPSKLSSEEGTGDIQATVVEAPLRTKR